MGSNDLNQHDRYTLLELAEETISFGLDRGHYLTIAHGQYPHHLRQPRASFVTLYCHDQLRGCIGNLQASRSLVEDVAHNAYAAAFEDPRFNRISWEEFLDSKIEISVLSELEVMRFDSEVGLLRQLRPGVDGILLEVGKYRATFLPKVWQSLPSKQDFFGNLKCKAGLTSEFWSDGVRCFRYTTESFSADELAEL